MPGLSKLDGKQARTVFRAVADLRQTLRSLDVLPGSLDAELGDLCEQLTDMICPYSVEECDRHVKKLNEAIPDWEHWYKRYGEGVTWHDRPRSPEHPLWHLYGGR
jgi:hypothetical protein